MKKVLTLGFSLILTASLLVGCNSSGNKDGFDLSQEIVVVTREEGSGTRGAFVELTGVLEEGANGNKIDRTTKEAITQMKTDTVLTTVGGNEQALGYVSIGSLNERVKALKVDGVEPSAENIKNGSYKIARPFNIATKSDISPLAKDFILFIMSKEGQDLVSKNYIAIDDNAASYSGSKPAGKIVIAGSSSVTPVMEKLRESYLEINPNAEIEVQQSDSSAGIQAAIGGTADIGMTSRDLNDSEKEELDYLAIAIDGIAIVSHPANTMDNLSLEDIRNIFMGELTKWSNIK